MISLDEALAIYPTIAPLEAVERSLEDCLGLRTVQRVLAPVDLPLADQSALDGYALNSADTESASTDSPVILEIDGEQAAGPLEATSVRPNTCRRIYTGAWLPDGFDAMVAQERVDASDSQIHLTHPVPQGNNIRQRGEEIRQSALLLPSGELIDPGRLAMLAIDEATILRERNKEIASALQAFQSGLEELVAARTRDIADLLVE